MSTVKVVLKDGEEKIYHNAEAFVVANNLLQIERGAGEVIAAFQSEYYQYWEQIED